MAKSDAYSERKSQPLPLGTHNARIHAIIDCGTQPKSNPAWTATPKLLFGAELVDTDHDFGKGFEEPFVKWISMNPYLGKKKGNKPSDYQVFLQKLLNRTIEKGESIPRIKLMGLPIQLVITQEDDENDPKIKINKLTSMKSVSAEDRKQIASIRNPRIYFELPEEGQEHEENCKYKAAGAKESQDMHWTECFLKLYGWQQKEIEKSPEFNHACAAYGVKLIEKDGVKEFVNARSAGKKASKSAVEESGYDESDEADF